LMIPALQLIVKDVACVLFIICLICLRLFALSGFLFLNQTAIYAWRKLASQCMPTVWNKRKTKPNNRTQSIQGDWRLNWQHLAHFVGEMATLLWFEHFQISFEQSVVRLKNCERIVLFLNTWRVLRNKLQNQIGIGENVHFLLWHIGNKCCVEVVQMKELRV
jgi:hypothetical protein